LAVRVMHWTNAVAMLVMITSGWGIYDDDVIIRGLTFNKYLRLGDWAAWSLNWHFAGMWLLIINGLCYLIYGVVTGRLRERLLPIRLRDVIQTVRDMLRLKIKHNDLTTYNAVQKILYIVVIMAPRAGRIDCRQAPLDITGDRRPAAAHREESSPRPLRRTRKYGPFHRASRLPRLRKYRPDPMLPASRSGSW